MYKILQGVRADETKELQGLLTRAIDDSTRDPIMLVPEILPFLFGFGFDKAGDEDYLTILGIDSELREFPLSEDFRARCHPDFLRNKDEELADFETHYRESLKSACNSILSKIQREFA